RTRSWPRDVSMALETNPDLSRRNRDRRNRAASSLRMVGLITVLILIPLLGALAVSAWPHRNARPIALLANLISGVCALSVWQRFDSHASLFKFEIGRA